MCLLDACICVQNTHILCTKHAYYRYAYKVFSEKQYIGLEPIYHEPILKQMANRSVGLGVHLYVGIV